MNYNRYNNGKIYQIINNIDDMVYIGSTCLPLRKRFYNHKKDYHAGKSPEPTYLVPSLLPALPEGKRIWTENSENDKDLAIKFDFLPDTLFFRLVASLVPQVTRAEDLSLYNDRVVLRGTKYWITNGLCADLFFLLARGEDDRISAFLVDGDASETFGRAKIADKMGVRASNTAELIFDDHSIPRKEKE